MIIMGGYSDDLSDHCVFALCKAENFQLQQDRTLVRQSAKKPLIHRNSDILRMFQPNTEQVSFDWLTYLWKIEIFVRLALQQTVVRKYECTQVIEVLGFCLQSAFHVGLENRL